MFLQSAAGLVVDSPIVTSTLSTPFTTELVEAMAPGPFSTNTIDESPGIHYFIYEKRAGGEDGIEVEV